MKAFYKVLPIVVVCVLVLLRPAFGQVAHDDADNSAYDDGWQLDTGSGGGDNGGFGFDPWVQSESSGGGGFFLTMDRQLTGSRSFGVFSADGGAAAVRPLEAPLMIGELTLQVRHDLNNEVSFSGFNLRNTVAGSFGTGELLALGMTPGDNNAVRVFGMGDGLTLSLGEELRGSILLWDVHWDAGAGTFSVTVTNLTGTGSASASGSLKESGTTVQSIGFGNFNTGGGQNLIFDDITVVPEPATVSLVGLGTLCALALRRRKRA
jgi:hypothetical protein